jgi:hypothetical protein
VQRAQRAARVRLRRAGAWFTSEVGRDCYVGARRRRLLLARRERAGLLAAKAERHAEADRRDDCGPTGWRRTWASGSAQLNPSHGERAASKQAVEREERRNELTSATAVSLAGRGRCRRGGSDGGSWRSRGDAGEKTGRRAVVLLEFRVAGSIWEEALCLQARGPHWAAAAAALHARTCARWARARRAATGAGLSSRAELGWELARWGSWAALARAHEGERLARWAERGGGGRREGKGAAGVGRLGRKAKGNRGAGHFTFSFYFRKCFPFFLFTPFDSIPNMPQIQIITLKHMHQTKVEFRVQHDATFHTPLEFSLLDYNYK